MAKDVQSRPASCARQQSPALPLWYMYGWQNNRPYFNVSNGTIIIDLNHTACSHAVWMIIPERWNVGLVVDITCFHCIIHKHGRHKKLVLWQCTSVSDVAVWIVMLVVASNEQDSCCPKRCIVVMSTYLPKRMWLNVIFGLCLVFFCVNEVHSASNSWFQSDHIDV